MSSRVLSLMYQKINIVVLFFIISILVNGSNLFSQSLYFIHHGPVEITGTPQVPYETRIYRYDEEKRELEQIWTLGWHKEAEKIGVYPSARAVVIMGNINNSLGLYVFSMDNMDRPSVLSLDDSIRIVDYHYYQTPDELDYIEIKYLDKDTAGRYLSFSSIFYSINDKHSIFNDKLSTFRGQIRLAGSRPVSINKSDVISFRSTPKGKTKAIGTALDVDIPPITDGVIQLGSLAGWVLIAYEPDFCALLSIPNQNKLTPLCANISETKSDD